MSRRYLEQPLGDELLIYDQDDHRAYALDARQARQWNDARGPRRRHAILALAALAGAAILAPTAAEACSQPHAVRRCGRGDTGRVCDGANGSCGRCFAGSCR